MNAIEREAIDTLLAAARLLVESAWDVDNAEVAEAIIERIEAASVALMTYTPEPDDEQTSFEGFPR